MYCIVSIKPEEKLKKVAVFASKPTIPHRPSPLLFIHFYFFREGVGVNYL